MELQAVHQSEVGRRLLLQPVEILDIPPQVLLALPIALLDILLNSLVFVVIPLEHNIFSILDDALAAREHPKLSVLRVVDSQLMAAYLYLAAHTLVYKHRRLCRARSHLAVLQLFQEKNIRHPVQIYCAVLALDNLVRTPQL